MTPEAWVAARVRLEKRAALSPQVIGAGLGAAAGAWYAPRGQDGRRRDVLQHSVLGAGLGLGAGHLAAHGIKHAPSLSDIHGVLRDSPLGVARREGLRAGAMAAGRGARDAGRRLAEGGRALAAGAAADARAIRNAPGQALKDIGLGATRPAVDLVRSPVETARRGWDQMGGLGQAAFVAGSVPGAVEDFHQQTAEDGRHRGAAERAFSSLGRVAAPLSFAATRPPSDNRITTLIGSQLAGKITQPAFAHVGRALDRAMGPHAAAFGLE